jgi:hypothetical protein
MLWISHAGGNSRHPISMMMYSLFFLTHLVGVVLVVVLEKAYDSVAYAFLIFTVAQGLLVFCASVSLLMHLLRHGSSTFEHFSFFRNLTSVIFLLALSIFYLHIASNGDAFIVPRDVQDMSSPSNRLDFFVTSLYASVGILSSVGYGDIVPVVWYARLIILPNFMFTFLANAMIFSAFTRFYAKTERHRTSTPYKYHDDNDEA